MASRLPRVSVRVPLVSASVTAGDVFFDLMFVFAVGRLADLVLAVPTAAGYVQAALVLVLTWAVYDASVRLTDQPEATGWPVRLGVLFSILGFLVMGIAGPEAYGGGRWPFAVAYLAVTLLYAVTRVATAVPDADRSWLPLPAHLGAAGLLVVAAVLPTVLRPYAWGVAVLLLVAATLTARRPEPVPVRAGRLAERHHFVVVVALAGTALTAAAGAQGRIGDPVVLVAVVCGVALVTTLWWIHFGNDEALAEQAEAEAVELRDVRQLVLTHSVTQLLHVAGLVLVVVGLRVMTTDPLRRLPLWTAAALAVGIAMFCLGAALYERRLRLGNGIALLVTASVALPTAYPGARVSGLSQLALLLGVLLVHVGLRRVARNPGGVER